RKIMISRDDIFNDEEGNKFINFCGTRTNFIKAFQFQECSADTCVFKSNKEGRRIILAIYVDDGLLAHRLMTM
ncbi:hypothetical protein RF179_17245, partial [Serratia marcescens]|uniref:hypothetical protein n=1 Tax=Serratia marcescens TaxID=615 RepID=UPI002812B993